MLVTLKTKIWLTVISIVLMFTFFTLFYFPDQQEKLFLKNYNNEVQNLANTVALGVNIALTEQNFKGVKTALEFVKDDPHVQFVSLVKYDTAWQPDYAAYKIDTAILETNPATQHPVANIVSNDSTIVKRSPFNTPAMSGAILLGFKTSEIADNKKHIKEVALLLSGVVLLIGILLGFWLAKNISVPVLALRNAAIRVGEGDLAQRVKNFSNDEIGELGKAFNNMVNDLQLTSSALGKTNKTLSDTNTALSKTVDELKSTQVQLIQAEKMASLGELTAGIAHEIQNPLNFVNNFSELNTELIEELKQEAGKGNIDELISLANDIKSNEEKINFHGKRADGIVKNMLQHSRKSTGQKELTDINALVDEYLNLSYHGLRAKDKSFNAAMHKHLDETIGKINIIPQDIGRVMLNLFNNAFYAVMQKKKVQGETYQPQVSVITAAVVNNGKNTGIKITVKDNGNGVPKNISDKIFQPFFTTKPAGQGTGLGLSLSYETITKAHSGTIRLENSENEGASFIIELPV